MLIVQLIVPDPKFSFAFNKIVWCKLVCIWTDLLEMKTEICSLSENYRKSSYMLNTFCLWLVELSNLNCNTQNLLFIYLFILMDTDSFEAHQVLVAEVKIT